jgi:hypothetical protein
MAVTYVMLLAPSKVARLGRCDEEQPLVVSLRADGKGVKAVPLFMDIHHHVDGLTAEAVKNAHAADLQTQDELGVQYLKYWFDEGSGKVFCLVEAPNKEAAEEVHRRAHGLVADEIIEVQEGV